MMLQRNQSESSLHYSEQVLQKDPNNLMALFLQGNARSLIELARKEKDPDMKKAIISKLSIMGSKEATDYLMEFLKE